MKRSRTSVGLGAILAAVLLLSGCTAPVLVEGTTVTVAASHSFSSYNPMTSYGNAPANTSIADATNSRFNFYDSKPELVTDPSFGSYEVVSRSPLVVKYTIRDGVKWSDGTPVDAADLLLAWVANSGARNTQDFDPSRYVDPETGRFTSDFPRDVVYFDGFSGNGLQLVTKTPVIGDDGRSITLTYDSYFVDWKLVFEVGVPAHVVAGKALGIKSHSRAKKALIKAITTDDRVALAKISRFWNTGFNFTSMPEDPELVVSDGPYVLTALVADDHAVLTANPEYDGDHKPRFEKVVIKYISDPLAAVKALEAGEVDVIAPQPTQDVAEALASAKGVTVRSGFDAAYEHLDLRFDHGRNGVFTDPLVRQAFLKVVPRQQILDQLVVPIEEDAQLRSSHVFMPGSTGYAKSVKVNGSDRYATVHVDEAKALLARAGVSKPTVCVLFDPSNPRRVTEFGLIQKSAALAGFAVTNCSTPDWRGLLGAPGAYDAALFALRPTTLAVTAASASFQSDSGATNYSHYSNPKVDAIFAQLDATSDPARQRDLLTRIDAQLWSDAYGVPLYQFPAISAFRPTVSGVSPSPLPPGVLWNVWAWKPVLSSEKGDGPSTR